MPHHHHNLIFSHVHKYDIDVIDKHFQHVHEFHHHHHDGAVLIHDNNSPGHNNNDRHNYWDDNDYHFEFGPADHNH